MCGLGCVTLRPSAVAEAMADKLRASAVAEAKADKLRPLRFAAPSQRIHTPSYKGLRPLA